MGCLSFQLIDLMSSMMKTDDNHGNDDDGHDADHDANADDNECNNAGHEIDDYH